MSKVFNARQPLTYNHQHGVALLTVLLLVVAITIVATSMLAGQRLALQESGLMLRQNQGLHYALGGEIFAEQLLEKDAKTNQTDSKQDIWAKPTPPYPVTGGMVVLTIEDNANKFNLNNLYHDGNVDEQALLYFKRLLKSLGLTPEIADAVLDWQDADNTPTGNAGAENDYYLTLTNGYMAANQGFISIEELKQVRGMDAKSYEKLAPYVVAVPFYLPININTAKASVLAALNENLNQASIETFVKQQQTAKPLENVNMLWQQAAFNNIPAEIQSKLAPLLDVKSGAFVVNTQVTLEGRHRYLTSYLSKNNGKVRAYQRSLASFNKAENLAE